MSGLAGVLTAQAGEWPPDPRAIGQSYPQAGLLALIPQQLRVGRILSFYVYNFDFLPLAGGGTDTVNVTIDANADFIVMYAQAETRSSDDQTFFPAPPITAFISDTGSGQNLMQSPFPYTLVFGDAGEPGVFPVPYVVPRSGTLQITLQSNELAGVDRNVRGGFCGFRSLRDPDYKAPPRKFEPPVGYDYVPVPPGFAIVPQLMAE